MIKTLREYDFLSKFEYIKKYEYFEFYFQMKIEVFFQKLYDYVVFRILGNKNCHLLNLGNYGMNLFMKWFISSYEDKLLSLYYQLKENSYQVQYWSEKNPNSEKLEKLKKISSDLQIKISRFEFEHSGKYDEEKVADKLYESILTDGNFIQILSK